MEIPARTLVALLFRRTPVRKVPLPRAWSPPPSAPPSAVWRFKPPRIWTWSLSDSRGWRVRLNWKSPPSPVGHQEPGMAPLGKETKAARLDAPEDGVDGLHIVRFEAAAEGIG